MKTTKNKLFENFKGDMASGLVVFLVALPLCLGIALASGAPLFAGIISGVVGGIVVGFLSNSNLSVTGPAAGLTAIVLTAITDLGGYDIFLVAVILAGLIQIGMGYAKAGSLSNYFPTSVIEGMLTGIGIIIIIKQIPHALGYDIANFANMDFKDDATHNSFSTLIESFEHIHYGALVITGISVALLVIWDKVGFLKKIKVIPGALVVVVSSIILNEIFLSGGSQLGIMEKEHLVNLPNLDEIRASFAIPNVSYILNPDVWVVAVTIAIVASIETLLCIEATDKLDPWKRLTNTNTELKAQGVGNLLSGILGGIPMTSVVVRSTANINSGGKTKFASIFHGILLLVSVLSIPFILNKIPLAALAAILIMIGYKLAKPALFIKMWNHGRNQFIPFLVTAACVVTIDLLKGVAIGIAVSLVFIMLKHLKIAYSFDREKFHDGDLITITLAQEVSFLNKAAIRNTLMNLPNESKVVIDASNTDYIDFDVRELLKNFRDVTSIEKKIDLELRGFKDFYDIADTKNTHIKYENEKTNVNQ
jgi:MFS superfamily sulfate permease-like transporter